MIDDELRHAPVDVRLEALQNLLVAHATGGSGDEAEYLFLRIELQRDPVVGPLLPKFVRSCRDLFQFWEFIKHKFATYAERRQYLWEAFRPALEAAEGRTGAPADDASGHALRKLDAEEVHRVWEKALTRRSEDPEGAITAARTLLETTCKHILDEVGEPYDDHADLPKLYKLVATNLNLAPEQHHEQVFKQILGGCQAVTEGLGALRNKVSDAHGKGRRQVRPAPRHAELAVNLAGAMSAFLVATWEARASSE